jgi:hypothetical protein
MPSSRLPSQSSGQVSEAGANSHSRPENERQRVSYGRGRGIVAAVVRFPSGSVVRFPMAIQPLKSVGQFQKYALELNGTGRFGGTR